SDYNVLFSASETDRLVAVATGDGDVTGGYSFAAWQARGRDARSQSLSGEKLFASVNAADFRLAASSPAAAAGAPLTGALAIANLRRTGADIGWAPPAGEGSETSAETKTDGNTDTPTDKKVDSPEKRADPPTDTKTDTPTDKPMDPPADPGD